MLGSCLDGRVTGSRGGKWLKIRSCYGHCGRAAPMYSVMLWVVLLDDGWGYGYVFRTGYIFRLGIRPCFRHLRVAFVRRMLLRPYTRYMPYMKIRPCFSNGVYVSVGDTAMFFEPGICFGWGYGYVFATYGWRLWGVFNTPLHVLHTIHRNTNVFSKPDIRYP